jgi:hypothetical protein
MNNGIQTSVKIEVGAILRMKAPPPHHHWLWLVTGIHYGALQQEGLVTIRRLDANPGCVWGCTRPESIVPFSILSTHALLHNP